MKRCYEQENFETYTGHRAGYNHCGHSRNIDGLDYCTMEEIGYVFGCADRKPKVPKQRTLFDYMREVEQ